MNKAEKIIKEKYQEMGYKCLHNRGFCDFIFFKVVDNKPTEVIFCEVKSNKDRLKYEQQIFRNVIETLGLNYKVEVIDARTIPILPNSIQPIPSHSKPFHSNPFHSNPNQVKKVINNEDETKVKTP